MSHKIICEKLSEEILKLTLTDSKTGNSFGIDAARELMILLKKLNAPKSKVKVLIFTGQDRFFCTGGNLKYYRTLKTKAAGLKINREISGVLKSLYSLKIAKIALVNGDCFGGGLELLSCFDLIYSRPESLFGFWQSKQALSFGWGGGARIAERLSPMQTRRALLGSHCFSAYEAARMGLVDQVLSRFEIECAVVAFANQIALNSKETISCLNTLTSKNEEVLFSKLWWSKEHLKRLL